MDCRAAPSFATQEVRSDDLDAKFYIRSPKGRLLTLKRTSLLIFPFVTPHESKKENKKKAGLVSLSHTSDIKDFAYQTQEKLSQNKAVRLQTSINTYWDIFKGLRN